MRGNEESATKSKRNKAAWAGKRMKGAEAPATPLCPGWICPRYSNGLIGPPGGFTPGATDPAVGGTVAGFQLDPARAKLVKWIVKQLLDGRGPVALAKELNQRGTPSFKGGHWHDAYIRKLIRNRALIGEHVPHEWTHEEDENGKRISKRRALEPVPGYYPALLTPEQFQNIQRPLTPLRGRHASIGKLYNILAGLARCHLCGDAMVVRKGSVRAPALVCSTARASAGCKFHSVKLELIEDYLRRSYLELIEKIPHVDERIEARLQNAQMEFDGAHDHWEELAKALEAAPSAAGAAALRRAEEHVNATRALLEAVQGEAVNAESRVLKLRTQRLREIFEQQPPEDVRTGNFTPRSSEPEALTEWRLKAHMALKELLEKVVVNYQTGHLELHWRHDGVTDVMFTWPTEEQESLPWPPDVTLP
jgi:hypothetical protein